MGGIVTVHMPSSFLSVNSVALHTSGANAYNLTVLQNLVSCYVVYRLHGQMSFMSYPVSNRFEMRY